MGSVKGRLRPRYIIVECEEVVFCLKTCDIQGMY